jgi:hypothetical protein
MLRVRSFCKGYFHFFRANCPIHFKWISIVDLESTLIPGIAFKPFAVSSHVFAPKIDRARFKSTARKQSRQKVRLPGFDRNQRAAVPPRTPLKCSHSPLSASQILRDALPAKLQSSLSISPIDSCEPSKSSQIPLPRPASPSVEKFRCPYPEFSPQADSRNPPPFNSLGPSRQKKCGLPVSIETRRPLFPPERLHNATCP